MPKDTQLLIVGGGVSGTAIAFTAARYSSIRKITIIDKCKELAFVNSKGTHNSQTLHMGDIETNYSLQKALKVNAAARAILKYVDKFAADSRILHRFPKMVIGVGEEEISRLRQRHEEFAEHFPGLELMEADTIARIEPTVALRDGKPRDEPMIASGMRDDACAADFAALSRSFVKTAEAQEKCKIEVILDTKVRKITPSENGYVVLTSRGRIDAKMVDVCAGGHSLLFAQRLGHGMHLSCLPVAGSFYHTRKCLNGKVYTVQNDKLPFAAVHGDPDILEPDKTRFGPTALVLPFLERRNWSTILDFFRVFRFDRNVFHVFTSMMKDKDIRSFIFKNFLYEIPFFYRYFFIDSVRKVVPDLLPRDIRYARGVGGLRPQLVNKKKRALALGEAKIDTGDRMIFNITPSPGASSCMDNAKQDVHRLCQQSGNQFNLDRWNDELS